jgi:hypothetical protein
VTAGQDPSGFWQITPREAMVILDGADARDRTQMRMGQAIAWATAQLVMIGMNAPKKFPKFDKAFPDPEARRKIQSPDEMWAAMESWAQASKLAAETAMKETP